MSEVELTALREKIRDITKRMIILLSERNRVSKAIGEVKRRMNLPVLDEGVEVSLEREVVRLCAELGVNERTGLKLLHTILEDSRRIQGYSEGGARVTPGAVAAKARRLAASGKAVIRLDIGEPDFRPPRGVISSCIGALRRGRTHYTDPRGIPELLSALKDYLYEEYGCSLDTSNMMITPGGRFAVFAAISAIMREGESALIIEPCWPAYREILEFAGCRTISVPTSIEDDWDPDLEKIKEAIRESTRAIIISYPSNPTGKIISRELFRGILEIASDRGLTVISDEVYNGYAYKDCPSVLEFNNENFILTSSFSKTWAMTGFRIGYAVSDGKTIERMLRVSSAALTCVPEFIQHAAIAALESRREAERNREIMKRRVDIAFTEISEDPHIKVYKPDGAMYLFPVSEKPGFDSNRFAEELLEKWHVAITPGTGFGDYPRAFRISLGQSEDQIIEGIRRIREALK